MIGTCLEVLSFPSIRIGVQKSRSDGEDPNDSRSSYSGEVNLDGPGAAGSPPV